MKKIIATGKGGVGKTTIIWTLAKLLVNDGHCVIVIDTDPSMNLAMSLGVPYSMLTTLADNKAAVREKLGARGHEDNEGQSHSHKVDEDDIEGLTGLNRERAGVKKDEQIGFYGNNVTFLETFIN